MLSPSLLALAIALSACSPSEGELETLAALDCKAGLRIATYNLRFDNPDDGAHAWPNRRAKVAEQIGLIAPDILGTQEGLEHQILYLESEMPTFAREGVGRDDAMSAGEYAAIFYRSDRFARIDGGTFWLSETPDRPKRPGEAFDWNTQLNRIATWVRLSDSENAGRNVLVFNAHFDHQSNEAKRKSALLLQQRARQMAAADEDVVILGDFNSRPDAPAHAILANNSEEGLADWDLTDAFYLAADPDISTTLTRWRLLLPGYHVDHVFVSDDARINAYSVHARKFFYQGAWRYTSDHLPVSVDMCQ